MSGKYRIRRLPIMGVKGLVLISRSAYIFRIATIRTPIENINKTFYIR